jgi:xylan 1,4-beta-xylosidase
MSLDLSRRAMLGAAAAGAASIALPARAALAPAHIDLTGKTATTPFPHYWEACVGSDRAAVAMRAQWQADLAQAHREAGFKSVRFHGLFDDEMGLCRRIGPNGPELNFLYIDQIFDAMLAMGVRPFVELSFMPLPLASNNNTIFWYRGNTSPPRDMALWVQVIEGLARHLLARYGAAEVTGWRFEVWNEPNLNFWSGTQTQYFELYAATARALKAIDPRLQVGGPATAQLMWIDDFLLYCAQHKAPVDFVSSHIYADDPQENLFGRDMHYPREMVIPRALEVAGTKIRASAFPGIPLVISEWTSQNPAFIAQTIRDCAGLCDTFSYWTFDNIFEEHAPIEGFDNTLYGLIGQSGVARPSYRAFQLLHRLGDQRLDLGRSVPAIATRRADDSIAVLAWNLITNADVSGMTGNPMTAPGVEPILDGPARAITLALPAGTRGAQVTQVDIANDPVSHLYTQMGRPPSPSPTQIATLRSAGLLPTPTQVSARSGVLRIDVPANGLALIEIAGS